MSFEHVQENTSGNTKTINTRNGVEIALKLHRKKKSEQFKFQLKHIKTLRIMS